MGSDAYYYDSFSDGFNSNCYYDHFDSYDGYDGYDGYNGRCSYNSVTYASNSFDSSKRNYNSEIITTMENQYLWDRLKAQQTKFGVTNSTQPSTGVGTIITASQAQTLLNGFTNLKSASYSSSIDWSYANGIAAPTAGNKIPENYKNNIKTTLTALENKCNHCDYRKGTT